MKFKVGDEVYMTGLGHGMVMHVSKDIQRNPYCYYVRIGEANGMWMSEEEMVSGKQPPQWVDPDVERMVNEYLGEL